jgi:biotin synthase
MTPLPLEYSTMKDTLLEVRSRNDPGTADADDSKSIDWQRLAARVLDGHRVDHGEALAVLQSRDEQLMDLLAAAYAVRRRHFGNRVQLYFLVNAKSGLCPEDCAYCSQSSISSAKIDRYPLLHEEHLLAGARQAAERKAKTYCMVISARGPSEREIDAVTSVVPKIKSTYGLKICVSLGLLGAEQARRLKECGVDRVNHNLNTSAGFYSRICTSHTYQDRLDTLRAVAGAGIEICSGGIVGMGESLHDTVDWAMALRELNVHSVPINFLTAIPGTPLEDRLPVSAREALRVLAMFRLVLPDREIRMAAGRERTLGTLQPLALYAANSLFVGDYLTTKGQPPEDDYRMIRDMGFEVTMDR